MRTCLTLFGKCSTSTLSSWSLKDFLSHMRLSLNQTMYFLHFWFPSSSFSASPLPHLHLWHSLLSLPPEGNSLLRASPSSSLLVQSSTIVIFLLNANVITSFPRSSKDYKIFIARLLILRLSGTLLIAKNESLSIIRPTRNRIPSSSPRHSASESSVNFVLLSTLPSYRCCWLHTIAFIKFLLPWSQNIL